MHVKAWYHQRGDTDVDQRTGRKRQRTDSSESPLVKRPHGSGASGPALSVDPIVVRKLQRASEELQLSSLPKVMTGRDHERSEIYNALRSSIQAQRAGGPIYISGLPGVGKTSIVKEIIQSLERQRAAGTLPRFVWIEVNGLHIPKPDVAYSVIWKALQEGGDVVRTCDCSCLFAGAVLALCGIATLSRGVQLISLG